MYVGGWVYWLSVWSAVQRSAGCLSGVHVRELGWVDVVDALPLKASLLQVQSSQFGFFAL